MVSAITFSRVTAQVTTQYLQYFSQSQDQIHRNQKPDEPLEQKWFPRVPFPPRCQSITFQRALGLVKTGSLHTLTACQKQNKPPVGNCEGAGMLYLQQ